MGENWRLRAIVDVAWYVNSSSFSPEDLTFTGSPNSEHARLPRNIMDWSPLLHFFPRAYWVPSIYQQIA